MTEPTVIRYRKFVYTDLDENSNKVWEIKQYADGTFQTFNGRIGATLSPNDIKPGNDHEVNALCNQKKNKGYREIYLAGSNDAKVSPVNIKTNSPEEALAVEILREANESIKTYLNTTIDALSQIQIIDARNQLKRIATPNLTFDQQKNLVSAYYKMIPTILPHKIDAADVVRRFDVTEQEQRLDQLEAGIAGVQLQSASVIDQLGGVVLKQVSPTGEEYAAITDHIRKTGGASLRIKSIFHVRIPQERQAYIDNRRGKDYVELLYHGTNASNVRHILRSGLIVPIHPSNGRRMGDGIYFSDKVQRSMSYCSGTHQRMLLIASVALGKVFKTEGNHHGKTPPAGYDSTCGLKTHSGLGDEYVVYLPSQQTIRFVVWLERY